MEREEAAASAVNVKIRPGAFYRGQIFPTDLAASEAMVHVQPGTERIDVKLRQSHAEFVRLYGDQFKRHEDQGSSTPTRRSPSSCPSHIPTESPRPSG